MDTPYQYYDNKLGIKLKYLRSDGDKHTDSLCIAPYRTLKKRLDSATRCETQLRGGCFNTDALVLFSSLDQATKDKITIKWGHPKTEIKKNFFAEHYFSDRAAADFYLAFNYGDDSKKLDLKFVEQYTYNASVLNTVLEVKTNRKAYIKAQGVLNVDIWQSLSNDVNGFRDVAHNLPTNKDALRRKVVQYQKEGYGCLISGKHTTQNAIKVKTNEQMALLDELIAKHNNMDNSQIANIYNMVAQRIQWPTITAQTVANRKAKSYLVTYAARNSSTALSNKILMQNKRSAPSTPMLYWTLDGWDAELMYQKTTTDKKGYSTTTYHSRLTMVVVLDPFNKYPVGYAIGTHETPELIKEAMRSAIIHTKELFGSYFKPYQLQSDNYAIKALTPMYEACTKHFTPAKVKNAKSKVIEPYFGYINKKYCQMFDNWSGFGVKSSSKIQPNSEFLNKIRHTFPDEMGCRAQLETVIAAERTAKLNAYFEKWSDVSDDKRLPMPTENFLMARGEKTGYTNQLTGEGIRMKIAGTPVYYDNYEINFRRLHNVDWQVAYNPHNLNEALAISPKGDYRFMLEQKHIQPMALAERTEADTLQLARVADYNKQTTTYVIEERKQNHQVLQALWENPLLNDTLAKHLLVDSTGQHKNVKSNERLAANSNKVLQQQEKAIEKAQSKTWQDEQNEYINQKIDLTKYLAV